MAMPDNVLRSAIENALVSGAYNTDVSLSHSVNIIMDLIAAEDFVAGRRLEGTMSNIRRFFCLFVTFDMLFVSLIWLILILINGDNIITAFEKQIVHYDVHISLFDVVAAAVCRFIVLIFFYALLQIRHWIVISVSTFLTCAFLIAKVFYYDWANSQQPILQVFLILISFVLAWSEAWFLDFRVVPQEVIAQRYFAPNAGAAGNEDSESTPLLRNFLQGLPSAYTESAANFYSPLQSPEVSIYVPDTGQRDLFALPLSQEEEKEYRKRAEKVLQDVWSTLNSEEWLVEKVNVDGDRVSTMRLPTHVKIYKLDAFANSPPKYLHDELFYRIEAVPSWNPTLLDSRKIQTIDERTDISYQLSAEGGAGIVSSREFVNLRHWDIVDDCYVTAVTSLDHPSLPPNSKYVRGKNGNSCWVFRPVVGEPNMCRIEWVLNTDLRLKGWIPQYVLDSVLISAMLDYMKYLRAHISKLSESGRIP